MPPLNQRGKFWPKIVEVAGTKQVTMMFRNSQGKISPYSTSGRTKKKKDPFGAVEKFEITHKYIKEDLEEMFVFSNGSCEGQLMTVMFDSYSDTKITEDGKSKTTQFGEVLGEIERRSGQNTVASLLTRLVRSEGYFYHNPELHDKDGGFLVENEELSPLSQLHFEKLIEAANNSCEQMDIRHNIPSPPRPRKIQHTKIKSSRAEADKVKISAERQSLLTAEAGVHRQSEICHQGIKLHPLKKLVLHNDIIRDIDMSKVNDLYEEMKVNLDASQIIFKVQLPIKKHSDFEEAMLKDDTLVLKTVSGRHRLLAIQKLLADGSDSKKRLGKLLSGDENIEEVVVPVILLSLTGTILANYEHLKSEMSNEHSRKIVLQDYVFLYIKLFSKLKDKERCSNTIRNLMVVSSQCSQQTVNGVLSVCHLPPEQLQSTCMAIKMKEEFKTEGQKKATFMQRKFKQKQALSLSDLKTIGNTPASHLESCNTRLLNKFIGWREYLSSCIEGKKMVKLISYIETNSQRKLEQLQGEYPEAFAIENLKNFLDEGFDVVQKFISNTLSQTGESSYDKFSLAKNGRDIESAEPELADVVVMLMKPFIKSTVEWILTQLQNINRDPLAVLIVCHDIHEILEVSRVIDCIAPTYGITFSNVVHCTKPSSRRKSGYTESLDSIVICGRNCKEVSMATLSKSHLPVCLVDVIETMSPRKVISISIDHEVFDITSERYQTHYFATSRNEFDKMHKKRKIESQKKRESMNETGMSLVSNGDTTASFERSGMSQEGPEPVKCTNQNQTQSQMKRQLSKQISRERKKAKNSSTPLKSDESDNEQLQRRTTRCHTNEQFLRRNPVMSPSIHNSSQFSPLSPKNFDPKKSSSPIKNINQDRSTVIRDLFGKKSSESGELKTQKSELFSHEQLSYKISNKIVTAKKRSISLGEDTVSEQGNILRTTQLRSMYVKGTDKSVNIPALDSNIRIHRRENEPLKMREGDSNVPDLEHPHLQLEKSKSINDHTTDFSTDQDSGIPSSFTPSSALLPSPNHQVGMIENEIGELSLNENNSISQDCEPSADQLYTIQKDINSSPHLTSSDGNFDEMDKITRAIHNLTPDVKIEDIVKEGTFNLSCVVTKIQKIDLGYVIRIMDGTEPKLYSLYWIDTDTQASTGEDHRFLDIYVSKDMFVKKFGSVEKGMYLKLQGLKCELYSKCDYEGKKVEFCNSQGVCVQGYKFLFDNGDTSVELMIARDPRVKTIKKKIAELKREELRIMEKVHYSRHDTVGDRRNQLNEMEDLIQFYKESPDLFSVLGVRECQEVILYGPSDSIETLKASAEDDSKESTVIRISGEELVKLFENKTVIEIMKVTKECVDSETRGMQKFKGILTQLNENIAGFCGSTDIEVHKSGNCIDIIKSDLIEGEVLTSLSANVEPILEILKLSYKEIFLPSNITVGSVQTKEADCEGRLAVVILA